MAVEDRSSSDLLTSKAMASLESSLERAPWSMCLFTALRRLERLRRDLPRVGDAPTHGKDVVAFGQDPFFGFPPRDIDSFTPGGGKRPARLNLFCFGLLGPMGPLPLHLTDEFRRRLRDEDDAAVAFLNVLTTRMASLFYKAWVRGEQAPSFDRVSSSDLSNPANVRVDPFLRSILYLGGHPLTSRQADGVPLLSRAYFSGRMGAAVRNPEGLAAIISDFFGVPVSVEEFHGRWVELPPSLHCRLGPQSATAKLGMSAVVGARYWEAAAAFRLVLGPMTFDDYLRLLPVGESARVLRDWVVAYAGVEHECDVQLVLAAAEVPRLRLGVASRLGWSCWLNSGAEREHRRDLVYELPPRSKPAPLHP